MRPRIGITAYWLEASWGPWSGMPACLAPQAYVNSILVAGGFPLLVPPLPEMEGFAEQALDTLDGLILVGGSDVGANTYGAESHETADPPNTRRDDAELALLRGALDRDMPLLGICRGFQLL
ncbi:MAG: gamma-glutamyl-gamma-aminobutyrate hydrolase family protein, partial [Thermoleophilia bacterium]